LADDKVAHQKEIETLKSAHTTAMSELEEKHKNAMDALARESSSASMANEKKLREQHDDEVNMLNQKHQIELEELKTQLGIEHDSKVSVINQKHSDDKIAMIEKLNQEHKSATEDLTSKYEKQISAMNDELTGKIGCLNKDLDSTKSQLTEALSKIENLEDAIKRAAADKLSLQEKTQAEKEELLRVQQLELRQEKERSENALLDSEARAKQHMQILTDDFNGQKENMEAEKQYLLRELAALNEKYLNRESRPEDVARIQQLEQEMVEKDHLVKKTKDEMMYFKREMLNREENYNAKFGAQPNVGVMNVLPTKGSTKGPQKKPPGRF